MTAGISAGCGPHCGITASAGVTREGHCDCISCHADDLPDGPDVIIVLAEQGGERMLPDWISPGTPMCASWYKRAGDYRPWHSERPDGCGCPVGPHAPASEHRDHCPVRAPGLPDREDVLDIDGRPEVLKDLAMVPAPGLMAQGAVRNLEFPLAPPPAGIPDFPERYMDGSSDRSEHHRLCDVSICHPECGVRRIREMEHWTEARKIIDGAGGA